MYRIIENVLNLCELARRNNKLKEKIEDQTEEIFKHLYKVIAFGNKYPEQLIHWAKEINGLLQVCKIKSKRNNKILPVEEILEEMMSVYSDLFEFSTIPEELASKYGYSDMTDRDVFKQIKKILPKLIEYIQSLKEKRANLDIILQIIKEEDYV